MIFLQRLRKLRLIKLAYFETLTYLNTPTALSWEHSITSVLRQLRGRQIEKMADNRKSDNPLERELDFEDAIVAAGDTAKNTRNTPNADARKKAEEAEAEAARKKAAEDRQVQMKEAMIRAGKESRGKRYPDENQKYAGK
ncbi:uncharacterized protein B0I36DRAFT_432415 [Microdochium trichocladiopsis]|uniref:Uncharacterized protein n=1 Tax=Microdochium trichocladiopsis TaxID=1682393 RepID=A0A9P8Y3D8_9PEZI|nr:uncharacterized protein B0I36DRAFT_432415 [Microdochium trichocladiopsis]KAH7029774.1 hypothetical protein B0I36DRAFT_432415 [Microdochium trichocladiopsis]